MSVECPWMFLAEARGKFCPRTNIRTGQWTVDRSVGRGQPADRATDKFCPHTSGGRPPALRWLSSRTTTGQSCGQSAGQAILVGHTADNLTDPWLQT